MADEQNGNNNKREIRGLLQGVQPGMTLLQKEKLLAQLEQAINYFLVHHFEKLVQVLYTIDVDEKRLKFLLKEREEEAAAKIIAELLLERQLQKAALRQRFSDGGATDDAEKW